MKKKHLHYILTLICANLLLISQAFPQNFIDLISAGSNYTPDNKYEDADSSFKFSHNFFNIQYPHVFKNEDVFATKLSFNHYNIKDNSSLDMYIIYLQLGLLKNFNERTSLRFAVNPKIASQLKDIEKNDFLIPCTGILQFKTSENFTYGFGLLYSKELFGHFLIPALHAKWRINNSWFFYADFPSYGYLMYYPKKTFKTGIYLSSSTTSIRLSEKYYSNYIQKSYADFSLFFDLCITKNLVLRTKGGYSIMRSLDMYGKDDTVPFTFSVYEFNDNRTQLNNDIDDALFFEISLNYRYYY
ncbi:MAG: DUF6268 family outer membrane beta-barrel protein [Bacteroidota bacterium]